MDHHPQVVPLLAEALRRLAPDVLVVAGDVSADGDLLEATLAALRPCAGDAVFVAGNHDLWCRRGEATSRERYETLIPRRARDAGFHPLGVDPPPRLCGHRFVGVTGWFDYSLRNLDLDAVVPRSAYEEGRHGFLQWNDKQRVIWPADEGGLLEDPAICAAQVRSLEAQIDAIGDEPAVAVTHHLPFRELVTSKGRLPWDFLNGFMGSSRLGDAIRRARGMRLAVSGHTHFRKDVQVQGTVTPLRALTSPVGYPREYRHAGQALPERVDERVTLVELP